jgi:hypothetical protein
MNSHQTILGIDPGTHYMNMAVIAGPKLVAYGVHQLRMVENHTT